MENVLEQEIGIGFLKKIKVVPQKAYAKILDKNGTRFVLRQYRIVEINGGYNMVNISYALNIEKDTITFYSVYLTSDNPDKTICLCTSENNKNHKLFDTILHIENNIWRSCLIEENI